MITLYVLIFLGSCFLLTVSSRLLVNTLSKIAKFLGWKEFVVAFFTMAFAVSLPNFFVGIISAIDKIPELSLGDVVGGNIIDLSLIVGLTALFSKRGLSASSRTVQASSVFTILIAVLPLILIYDGTLSRTDGILLLSAFVAYVFWVFHKQDRFKKIYDGITEPMTLGLFFKNSSLFLGSAILLILAADGIVRSSVFFADYFNLPLSLVGVLVVGIGNSLPETFFSLAGAREGQDWLVLGDLMGGILITSTLVLGMVSLINPIQVTNLTAIAIGRIFLIISALFFLFFIKTDSKITRKEAIFLILIYVVFILFEIIFK